ncbi:MAG: DUF2723 domain-containing protein [Paludibacter sp.]|nr:DUF2723 domain-containing protein [Paludibacter sp.]
MKRFKLYNNIFGWVAFLVAAITYLSTIEPTGSFWDCGEFASSAYKFDVGHPPGAPFFMLLGKFFTLFASDPSHVATMINRMSALCSAFTILFLFWTITHLARKIVINNEETDFSIANIIAIIGTGLVGALAYTFTDSFWFSAVESEVYALSAVFTAVVFWLILKWEQNADSEHSDRWLILIAYLTGLSVGVHLLNLLTIPAIALVYYFKRYQPSTKGVIVTVLASFAMVIFVLYGLVQGFVQVAAWFELMFVNGFGMPYNSGLLIYLIIVIALLIWSIYLTRNPKNPMLTNVIFLLTLSFIGVPFLMGSVWIGILIIAIAVLFLLFSYYFGKKKINYQWLNTIIVMAVVMLIGYSTFGIIMIRSSAKPTMDQNAPNNVFSLKSYLNREQYGDRPLFYGEYFNAVPDYESAGDGMYRTKIKNGAAIYEKIAKDSENQKDKYVVVGNKQDVVFVDAFNTLFPRMYSRAAGHSSEYKAWSNMTGKTIRYQYIDGTRTDVIPTFFDNLTYFFNYQLNYMYFRYFMWNFSGRQNDLAGNGEIDKGNWITGFNFIDKGRAGINKDYPDELKNNKGHNVYYMLPFLLGVLGLVYQVFKNKNGKYGFWITFTLFFMTGIAIILYLNQTPLQPRERDYAYAGSFYAYAIWIGIGVLGIISFLEKIKIPPLVASIAATVLCLVVPVQMATQNWDDHDRSGKYAMRDFGANYLNSCEPNSIIFSNGDNDTFPLWYNQEVEGVRPDVRVCNLSYIQTDWYIDQMKRASYESAPLPISFDRKDYITGTNDYVQVNNILKEPIDVDLAYNFIKNSDKSTKLPDGSAYLPTNQIYISVNADSVIAAGALPESRRAEIIPQIKFNFNNAMTKGDLIVIDILNSNKWKRPVYFASTVGSSNYLGLDKNGQFVITGMAYQVLPINTTNRSSSVDVEKTYENLMTKFKYGNVADPKVYSDETVRRMVSSHRIIFLNLVDVLLARCDSTRAHNVLDKQFEVFPPQTTGYDNIILYLAADYYRTGDHQKANLYLDDFLRQNNQYLNWGFSLNRGQRESIERDLMNNFSVLQQALQLFDKYNENVMLKKYMPDHEKFAPYFQIPEEHSETR